MIRQIETGGVEGVYVVNSLGDCETFTSGNGWSVRGDPPNGNRLRIDMVYMCSHACIHADAGYS